MRRLRLLVLLCLLVPSVTQAQTLNDLWKGAYQSCSGVPCLNVKAATASGVWTGNDSLNDLFKLSFSTCSGVPCLNVALSSSGGGVPGGSDTQVQFNDSGAFGGDAGFTYNKTTDTATLGALTLTTALAATSGGTGQASYAVGDLLYADTTTSLAKRAAVATGQVLASAGVSTAPAWTASPTLTTATLSAGSGTATYKPSGIIATNLTPQATTGTSEETLATVTVPANTLAANGQSVLVRAYFTSAANTNAKTVTLRWNGTAGTIFASQTGFTASGAAVVLTGTVLRTGASAQYLGGTGIASGGTARANGATDTVALSGDVVIYVRGTTATAAGDVTFQALTVEYQP